MVDVTLSLGPMLIGTFANMILYGILVMQALFYFQTYKKDASWIKCLVTYLFIVETINTGCDIAMMYQPLILEYGQIPKNFPLMFASEPIIIVAISTPIQLFFSWRIHKLTKMIILPIFISLFALVSLGGGIWTTVMLVVIKVFARKPELHEPALVWFLASCVADVLITAVLVVSLSKRKTGFTATDDAISKIIRMTIQTGLLTALFAIGDVVFFMTLPKTGLNFLWDLALSKLYTNCLLSTLNARATLNSMTSTRQPGLTSETTTMGRKPGTDCFDMGSPLQSPRQQVFGSSYIELDSSRDSSRKLAFDATSSFSQRDMECHGITVTKVVETLPDPEPGYGYAR